LSLALIAAWAPSVIAAGAVPRASAAPAAPIGDQPSALVGAAASDFTAPRAQGAAPFTAIHFVDARRGWLAGLGLILGTVDGGQTWAPQFSTTDTVSSFAFVDARTGWAVGARALVGTTNGGQQWERRGDGIQPLMGVSFATADLGWAIPAPQRTEAASDGTPVGLPPPRLLASDDGGQAWAAVSAPGPLQSVCRADAERGWAAGNGHVWRQASAGSDWTLTLTSPAATDMAAPEQAEAGFGSEVQCTDADTAWVLFTAPGGMMQTGWALYRTGDAGATWTAVAQSGQFFPATGAPHGGGGWNRDAGQSWQDLPPLPATFGQAIVSAQFAASFPTPDEGWLIAPGSASVYATTDGGATWTAGPLDIAR
jgi:photosystem II stability/assembly factor-like uncharacterized protein